MLTVHFMLSNNSFKMIFNFHSKRNTFHMWSLTFSLFVDEHPHIVISLHQSFTNFGHSRDSMSILHCYVKNVYFWTAWIQQYTGLLGRGYTGFTMPVRLSGHLFIHLSIKKMLLPMWTLYSLWQESLANPVQICYINLYVLIECSAATASN